MEKKPEQKKAVKPTARKKKSAKVFTQQANAYITATYNNTIITVTDPSGNTIAWSSAGHVGFKGPKKSTPYAAGVVVRNVLEKVRNVGIKEMAVYVRGVGSGRESAIRALNAQGMNITAIKDVTPIPHNGPRQKKPRRV